MTFTITKTNLNEWNGGRPSPRAVDPARFKGVTPVWVVYRDDGEPMIGLGRKRDAEKFAIWANESGWDGDSDPELSYGYATDDWDLKIV